MLLRLALLAIYMVAWASCLSLEEAEEGSCQGVHYHPIQNIDFTFLDGLTYMPAASRYNFYRIASTHPRFQRMRDFEILNNMCLVQETFNVSETAWHGSAIGFGGQRLGQFTFTPRHDQTTVVDSTHQFPDNPEVQASGKPYNGTATQIVTLTDHKTFAFFGNCWTDSASDQRAWEVASNTPELSASAKRLIRRHAESLGFKPEDVIFLNYKSCGDFVENFDVDDEMN